MGDEKEIPDKSCTRPPKMQKGRKVLIKEVQKRTLPRVPIENYRSRDERGDTREDRSSNRNTVDAELEIEGLIVQNEKIKSEKENLEEKYEALSWTVRIRNLIFKVEAFFRVEKLHICYQCGDAATQHEDEVICVYDPKSWLFPVEPEEQRIFIRERRWRYLLFTEEKKIADDFRLKRLKGMLATYYGKIKSEGVDKSRTETFLSAIPDYDTFVRTFCYFIADCCEFCNVRVKHTEQVELREDLKEINQFGIPTDDFIVMFINSFARIKNDGPIAVYKDPFKFNEEFKTFIPKVAPRNK